MDRKRPEIRSPGEPLPVLQFPATRRVLYGVLACSGVSPVFPAAGSTKGSPGLSAGLVALDPALVLTAAVLVSFSEECCSHPHEVQ